MVEAIGMVASILIVCSMVFKTTTFKGTMLMRIINMLGSVFFIIYGFVLPAYATGVANICVFIINVYYIVKEYKDYKKALQTC